MKVQKIILTALAGLAMVGSVAVVADAQAKKNSPLSKVAAYYDAGQVVGKTAKHTTITVTAGKKIKKVTTKNGTTFAVTMKITKGQKVKVSALTAPTKKTKYKKTVKTVKPTTLVKSKAKVNNKQYVLKDANTKIWTTYYAKKVKYSSADNLTTNFSVTNKYVMKTGATYYKIVNNANTTMYGFVKSNQVKKGSYLNTGARNIANEVDENALFFSSAVTVKNMKQQYWNQSGATGAITKLTLMANLNYPTSPYKSFLILDVAMTNNGSATWTMFDTLASGDMPYITPQTGNKLQVVLFDGLSTEKDTDGEDMAENMSISSSDDPKTVRIVFGSPNANLTAADLKNFTLQFGITNYDVSDDDDEDSVTTNQKITLGF